MASLRYAQAQAAFTIINVGGLRSLLRFLFLIAFLPLSFTSEATPFPERSALQSDGPRGFYRQPTIFENKIAFISEDDLWIADLVGGRSQRLTVGMGMVASPHFSPDGKQIAFSAASTSQHADVYVTPVEGGRAKRLTFLGASVEVIGWDKESYILFASSHDCSFTKYSNHKCVYRISPQGGNVQIVPTGPASFLSFGPSNKQVVLQRQGSRWGNWKRYRGGAVGTLWIDVEGKGQFAKLFPCQYDCIRPLWAKDRIYFLSNYEGNGNLYSCLPNGQDVRRHTDHQGFYPKSISTDGKRIIYSCGGDLYMYDIQTEKTSLVSFSYTSSFPKKRELFAAPSAYLTSYALSPTGDSLILTTRGKLFQLTPREGPVFSMGSSGNSSYRQACWLAPGKGIVAIKDEGLKDVIEVHTDDPAKVPLRVTGLDVGRLREVKPSPIEEGILLCHNHRNELFLLDIKSRKIRIIDKNNCLKEPIDFCWSPDGKWVAYTFYISPYTSIIRLYHLLTGSKTDLTRPVVQDFCPTFDPEGKYLYFLSRRNAMAPLEVGTSPQKALRAKSCRSSSLCLVTLQKDLPNPFFSSMAVKPVPAMDKQGKQAKGKRSSKEVSRALERHFAIDLEGIQNRIIKFPIKSKFYNKIEGMKKGKVLYSTDQREQAELGLYDFSTLQTTRLASGVKDFVCSLNGSWIAYSASDQLHVRALEGAPYTLNWKRIKLSVDPVLEWQHMFDEAWRFQKEYFWREDMGGIDWEGVYARYKPLVNWIGSKNELMELIREMMGELATSHMEIIARREEDKDDIEVIGKLGIEVTFSTQHNAYRITKIYQGEWGNFKQSSPLLALGQHCKVGDLIWRVAGTPVSQAVSPQQLLVNQVNDCIPVEISNSQGKNKRLMYVTPLADDYMLRYRDWVNANRAYVHAKTKGRVGYIHIPDVLLMGAKEWFRGYLLEYPKKGLIIDLRFNAGGDIRILNACISPLARKNRVSIPTRHYGVVHFPFQASPGSMAVLANENTGSAGDLFCHEFKRLQLGPFIGKRTNGATIGVSEDLCLVEGTQVHVPTINSAKDVENHGVEPDIEVEITPEDYVAGRDPQLDKAIEEVLKLINKQ